MKNQHPTSNIQHPFLIRLKKRLGQHILKDQGLLEYIADACDLTPQTTVLEIGAGIANLTECLARRAGKVVAVELDEQFRIYHTRLSLHQANVKFLYEDILDMEMDRLEAFREADDLVITGNIPFNITGPFLMKMLEGPLHFRRMILMLQKEVAQRLTAQVGTKATNAFTLKVRYFCEPSILKVVPRDFFHPKPKVDSAIVLFLPHTTLPYDTETRRRFFRLLDAAFAQKRKIILNSLLHTCHGAWSKEELIRLLQAAGIDPVQRAETVSLERFKTLFEILKNRWP